MAPNVLFRYPSGYTFVTDKNCAPSATSEARCCCEQTQTHSPARSQPPPGQRSRSCGPQGPCSSSCRAVLPREAGVCSEGDACCSRMTGGPSLGASARAHVDVGGSLLQLIFKLLFLVITP